MRQASLIGGLVTGQRGEGDEDMRIRLGDLRQIIREAIGASDDLATIVRSMSDTVITGVVYSVPTLFDVVREHAALPVESQAETVDDLVALFRRSGIVVGYIKIGKPSEPCSDAWKVIGSWGPMMGEVVYDLALALSPTGRLVSDRVSVSGRARTRWEKLRTSRGAMTGGGLSLALDDEYAPSESQLTPDDPNDDCRLYQPMRKGGPDPILDRVYVATGSEAAKKEAMMANHEEAMAEVIRIDPDETRKRMEDAIFRTGGLKFGEGLMEE